MGEHTTLLITICTRDNRLLRVALKYKTDSLPCECTLYPMEPPHMILLTDLLPLHVQTAGKIVDVEEIFDAVVSDVSVFEEIKP